MTILRRLTSLLAVAAALTGCFTGVESTPRIQAPSSYADDKSVSPEAVVLAGVDREQPRQWRSGKRFHVTDKRFNLLLGPDASRVGDLAGHDVVFSRFRAATSLTGDSLCEVVFTLGDGSEAAFRTGLTMAAMDKASRLEVPFTIETSVVDEARRRLLGQRFWITTRLWRDSLDNITAGRLFVPVTVTEVAPGSETLPLRLRFAEDRANGSTGYVFLTVYADSKTPRVFASTFSLTDPRRRYPAISDSHWALISEGRVEPGMTVEEVRLALGAPREVRRSNTASILVQRWIYDNGRYLVFEDGILTETR